MFLEVYFKQTSILCLVLMTCMLFGCGFSQANTVETANRTDTQIKAKTTMKENEESQLVPVSAIKFDGNKITAGVISFGCTTATDFAVEHAIVNGLCEVRINRVNRDLCRRAPFVTDIELDWSQPDDCRDLNIVIANPLLVTSDNNTIEKRLK